MIAGDHGAHFITLGPRPGPVGNASHRGNDKGVGRKDELGCEPDLRRRRRHPDEAPAALAFEGQRIVGAQRQHSMPSLRRSDQGQRAILADLSGKVAGAPQPASRIVTALRLDVVEALAARAAIGGKGRAFGALHGQPQNRQIRPGADLVSVAPDGQRIARGERLADRCLERTKIDQGSEPQADAPAVAEQAKGGMHDVLARGHDNRLLDDDAVDLISPARQAHVQREIEEPAFLSQVHDAAVCELDVDLEIVEDHHAAERSRLGGDQEAVVAPGDRPRYRRRGVAAQPVRHEPFARRLRYRILVADGAAQVNHSLLGDRGPSSPRVPRLRVRGRGRWRSGPG